jgi:carbonic anhydrase/acetyltransferase-like protein (isoleucine patch superfamily)
MLAAGVPAREKKRLSGSALNWTRTAAEEYQEFSKRYMTASRVLATGGERVA